MRREVVAWALALASHVLAIAMALRLAPAAISPSPPAAKEESWMDLELVPSEGPVRIRPRPAAAMEAASADPGRSIEPPRAGRSESPGPQPTAPPPEGGGAETSRPPAPEYGPTEADPVLALPPGAGGLPVWSIPGAVAAPGAPAPAPTTADAPRRTDREVATHVLEGTLGGMDRDKGLEVQIGGITARAVEDAGRRISLPHDCRATFEVRIGAGGELLGVRATRSTAGDAALWEKVARAAASALAARSLPMRGRARRGATVIVELRSRYVYPGGAKERQAVDYLSNMSDVLSTTYVVRTPDDKALPPGAVQPVDRSGPYSKKLPTGVAPVEMKPLLPDR